MQRAGASNSTLVTLIDHDLRFRLDNTAFQVSADQKTLTINRRQALDLNNLNQSDDVYAVRFQSVCIDAPGDLAGYAPLPQQLSEPGFQKSASCLKKLACTAGKLPQVQIAVNGSGRIPAYPVTKFPQLDAARSRNLGTAACFIVTGQQVQVVVDGLYAAEGGRFKVVSQERAISIAASDVQLLPHDLSPSGPWRLIRTRLRSACHGCPREPPVSRGEC